VSCFRVCPTIPEFSCILYLFNDVDSSSYCIAFNVTMINAFEIILKEAVVA
jgi:hypothetical protein